MDLGFVPFQAKKGKEWPMMDEMCLGTTGVGLGYSWVVFDLLMVMVGSGVLGLDLVNKVWV